MKKYKTRAEVEDKYKWDLTDLFKDEKDFDKSFKQAKKDVCELKKYVGCTKDSSKLLEFLDNIVGHNVCLSTAEINYSDVKSSALTFLNV